MPIYEYECIYCGEQFELRRSMSDNDTDVKCPKCGATDTRRVFSTFATASSGEACLPSGSG